jgi:hypothetical protein
MLKIFSEKPEGMACKRSTIMDYILRHHRELKNGGKRPLTAIMDYTSPQAITQAGEDVKISSSPSIKLSQWNQLFVPKFIFYRSTEPCPAN